MATCLDYAKIAYAAYFTRTTQYYDAPPGHMVDDWTVQKWEEGTLFGNGYQGGIWQNRYNVVVGCCGTNPKQSGKLIQDLVADLKIALKLLPSQSRGAIRMVKAAKEIAGCRRVSVTGHSLGGGLAQIAGVACGVPFVTFNAPAMRSAIEVSKLGIFCGATQLVPGGSVVRTLVGAVASCRQNTSPGLNFRIRGDKVSSHFNGAAGDHVGVCVDLDKCLPNRSPHGKDNCWQAILQTDWSNIDPFEAL
jgi:hypothetical protein